MRFHLILCDKVQDHARHTKTEQFIFKLTSGLMNELVNANTKPVSHEAELANIRPINSVSRICLQIDAAATLSNSRVSSS